MITVRVNNIASNVTDSDFQRLFSSKGRVIEYSIVRDQQTNLCQGYGFVVYEDVAMATIAVNELNGENFCGTHLQLSIDKQQVEQHAVSVNAEEDAAVMLDMEGLSQDETYAMLVQLKAMFEDDEEVVKDNFFRKNTKFTHQVIKLLVSLRLIKPNMIVQAKQDSDAVEAKKVISEQQDLLLAVVEMTEEQLNALEPEKRKYLLELKKLLNTPSSTTVAT